MVGMGMPVAMPHGGGGGGGFPFGGMDPMAGMGMGMGMPPPPGYGGGMPMAMPASGPYPPHGMPHGGWGGGGGGGGGGIVPAVMSFPIPPPIATSPGYSLPTPMGGVAAPLPMPSPAPAPAPAPAASPAHGSTGHRSPAAGGVTPLPVPAGPPAYNHHAASVTDDPSAIKHSSAGTTSPAAGRGPAAPSPADARATAQAVAASYGINIPVDAEVMIFAAGPGALTAGGSSTAAGPIGGGSGSASVLDPTADVISPPPHTLVSAPPASMGTPGGLHPVEAAAMQDAASMEELMAGFQALAARAQATGITVPGGAGPAAPPATGAPPAYRSM